MASDHAEDLRDLKAAIERLSDVGQQIAQQLAGFSERLQQLGLTGQEKRVSVFARELQQLDHRLSKVFQTPRVTQTYSASSNRTKTPQTPKDDFSFTDDEQDVIESGQNSPANTSSQRLKRNAWTEQEDEKLRVNFEAFGYSVAHYKHLFNRTEESLRLRIKKLGLKARKRPSSSEKKPVRQQKPEPNIDDDTLVEIETPAAQVSSDEDEADAEAKKEEENNNSIQLKSSDKLRRMSTRLKSLKESNEIKTKTFGTVRSPLKPVAASVEEVDETQPENNSQAASPPKVPRRTSVLSKATLEHPPAPPYSAAVSQTQSISQVQTQVASETGSARPFKRRKTQLQDSDDEQEIDLGSSSGADIEDPLVDEDDNDEDELEKIVKTPTKKRLLDVQQLRKRLTFSQLSQDSNAADTPVSTATSTTTSDSTYRPFKFTPKGKRQSASLDGEAGVIPSSQESQDIFSSSPRPANVSNFFAKKNLN